MVDENPELLPPTVRLDFTFPETSGVACIQPQLRMIASWRRPTAVALGLTNELANLVRQLAFPDLDEVAGEWNAASGNSAT